MKKIINQTAFLLMVTIFSIQSRAQDKGIDINVTVDKKHSEWYQQPWAWIAGGAVFILILVALLRGRGKKE